MIPIAIKGHPTRGKEIIEILEMMGYYNYHKYSADTDILCYYGGENTSTIYYDWVNNCKDMHIFTLEEFLEKFPYKVGDKVQRKGATYCDPIYEVEKMQWVDNHVEYTTKHCWYNSCHNTFTAEYLQPYKEETMEENLTIQDIRDNNAEWLLNKLQELSAKKVLQTISDLYDKLHKPQYPKTYEECCKVLSLGEDGRLYTKGYKASLIQVFQQLIICRNAYWKIASEQMKLGKPWEPDWESESTPKYTISQAKNKIRFLKAYEYNHILSFPTTEMREAFYENFKKLIEVCKELL